MRVVQEFSDNELKQLLNEFYKYFINGFEFEEFLKPFLESLGLSEVIVTKKTGDDGVDLTAVKNGIVEINNADNVKYKIQAKRNNPSSRIAPEKIDALRGNLAFNEKGLFITTAKVSKKAKELAISKDPYKPVFVIDGIELIRICIEKQIGFAYKPIFSRSALDEFTMKKTHLMSKSEDNGCNLQLDKVEKIITLNDVRARIISVPRFIVDKISNNKASHPMKLVINNYDKHEITFCPSRNFIAHVTGILKKYGLIQEDGSIVEKTAVWSIDEVNQIIYLNIL